MNMSQVVEKISKHELSGLNIMLKNGSIMNDIDYINMVKEGKVSPEDVHVIIHADHFSKKAEFFYPFLMNIDNVIEIMLSRKGFYLELFDLYYVFPADPQYLIYVKSHKEYITIEIINVDEAIKITNAEKIVSDKLKNNDLSIYEYHDIRKEFLSSQKLGGHELWEVKEILFRYYDQGERSLESEVFKIIEEYYKLFKPVRFYF